MLNKKNRNASDGDVIALTYRLAKLKVKIRVVLNTERPRVGLFTECDEDYGPINVDLDPDKIWCRSAIAVQSDMNSSDLGDVDRSRPKVCTQGASDPSVQLNFASVDVRSGLTTSGLSLDEQERSLGRLIA